MKSSVLKLLFSILTHPENIDLFSKMEMTIGNPAVYNITFDIAYHFHISKTLGTAEIIPHSRVNYGNF